MNTLHPTFATTHRGLDRLQNELTNLQRQAAVMVLCNQNHMARREAENTIIAPSILQQERLFGRMLELQWLLQHVKPMPNTGSNERKLHHA